MVRIYMDVEGLLFNTELLPFFLTNQILRFLRTTYPSGDCFYVALYLFYEEICFTQNLLFMILNEQLFIQLNKREMGQQCSISISGLCL